MITFAEHLNLGVQYAFPDCDVKVVAIDITMFVSLQNTLILLLCILVYRTVKNADMHYGLVAKINILFLNIYLIN